MPKTVTIDGHRYREHLLIDKTGLMTDGLAQALVRFGNEGEEHLPEVLAELHQLEQDIRLEMYAALSLLMLAAGGAMEQDEFRKAMTRHIKRCPSFGRWWNAEMRPD